VYQQTNGTTFTGTIQSEWLAELEYQHNNAYAAEFGTQTADAPDRPRTR
jgi:hypothetical protein